MAMQETTKLTLEFYILQKREMLEVSDGMARTRRKAFKCSMCPRAFLFNSEFVRHLRVHTGEKPYACNICGKRFSKKSNMKSHQIIHINRYLLTTHYSRNTDFALLHLADFKTSLKRLWQCSTCDRSFTSSHSLEVHNRRHTGEHPFHCSVCKKGFVKKNDLDRHMRVPTGEKPFPCNCNSCGQRFSIKSYMNMHQLTPIGHKNKWNTKLMVILFMVGSFQISFRRFQEGIPSPWKYPSGRPCGVFQEDTGIGDKEKYICSVCNKSVTNMKVHILTHTGEKPHACDICGKRFAQKNNLKHHRMIHTGEKPYVCPTCGRGFNQRAHLKGHMIVHMNE
ncbi:zinc finger protein 585B-like [Lineus longissimus]|uniref:zinc finger protein 585B-like n=1 Tax=Lineus longissimus TaxID=88925 RepID=UPI00315C7DCC